MGARRVTGAAACDCSYPHTPPLQHKNDGHDPGGNTTPDRVASVREPLGYVSDGRLGLFQMASLFLQVCPRV